MKEFIIILVKNLQTTRIEKYVIAESSDLPADVVANRISQRLDDLHETFPIERYDISWEGHSSLESLRRSHSQIKVDATKIEMWG